MHACLLGAQMIHEVFQKKKKKIQGDPWTMGHASEAADRSIRFAYICVERGKPVGQVRQVGYSIYIHGLRSNYSMINLINNYRYKHFYVILPSLMNMLETSSSSRTGRRRACMHSSEEDDNKKPKPKPLLLRSSVK